MKQKNCILLSAGILALFAGLVALATRPLLSVLAILGGMALSICSGVDLISLL